MVTPTSAMVGGVDVWIDKEDVEKILQKYPELR
jgi:hypothetical protein